jgi:hypothetical protein
VTCIRLLPILGALLAAGACRGGAATAAESMLPGPLMLRSDTPFIGGTIVTREDDRAGGVQLLVRAPSGSDARVPEARVSVRPDSLLLWRDARAATVADLRVGRTVIVWVRGPAIGAPPPFVTASAVLVER